MWLLAAELIFPYDLQLYETSTQAGTEVCVILYIWRGFGLFGKIDNCLFTN